MLDNTTNRSISSRVLELLHETADDTQFTATDLVELLGLPRDEYGSVTGFLSRAAKLGLIKFVGATIVGNSKRYVYQIDNRHAVVNVHHKRGRGGHSGPRRGHKHLAEPMLNLDALPPKLPPVPSLADAMLELAARLESEARNMQNVGYVLQEIVTDENLLAEVARRFHRR